MNKTKEQTPKAQEDAVETAQSESQDGAHSVELKGEKVHVRHDFQRRKLLREKPLLLVDKNGVPVSESQPEWHYAWFDDDDLEIRLREGYEIVKDPDVIAPAQRQTARNMSKKIQVNELTACRIPTADWLAWNEYIHETETCIHERTLEDRLDEDLVVDGKRRGIATRDGGGIRIQKGE